MFVLTFPGFEFSCAFHIEFLRDFKKAAGGNYDHAGKDHLQSGICDAKPIHYRREKDSFAHDCRARKSHCTSRKDKLRRHAFGAELEIGPMTLSVFFATLESFGL